MQNRMHIVCAPFSKLFLPSLDVAVLKAYLRERAVDVTVDVSYLPYAMEIGGGVYEALRQSVSGDAVFSALLFPEHRRVMESQLSEQLDDLDFNGIVHATNDFFQNHLETHSKELKEGSCVLLHMYSKQLFPSLYLGKLIHQRFGLPIWLSGFHCQDECGESLLRLFPFIERVFGKNIERSVGAALGCSETAAYRGNLDDLPTPDYSDFFLALTGLPDSFRKDHLEPYWLQVELNRGCWWNSCSFCTLNCKHDVFEEKSIDHIVRDCKRIIATHKTTQILANEFNSGKGWRDVAARLNSEFGDMGEVRAFCFKITELQDEDDVRFLRENNVAVLIGVESLSKKSLQIINKGNTVIEAIRTLKYMERHDVKCYHNLMCSLPFETDEDYVETENIIRQIVHLIPPFDLELFRLTHGSAIQKNPQKYCVEKMGLRKEVEAVLLPPELHERYVPFFLDFESTIPGLKERESKWVALIKQWRDKYYAYAQSAYPKRYSLLAMRKIDDILEIHDARYRDRPNVYSLSGIDREVYEFCDPIRSIDDIANRFPTLGLSEIERILETFVNKRITLREEANYLSLAI